MSESNSIFPESMRLEARNRVAVTSSDSNVRQGILNQAATSQADRREKIKAVSGPQTPKISKY